MTAFARHQGVVTRTLDMTKDPLVAAYFAASSACEKLYYSLLTGDDGWKNKKLSICKLDYKSLEMKLEKYKNEDLILNFFEELPIHYLNPTFETNVNAIAQDAVLLFQHRQTPYNEKPVSELPVDKLLSNYFEYFVEKYSLDKSLLQEVKLITKSTIPVSESPKMLVDLKERGYHGSTMFPATHKGAVEQSLV